MIVNLLLSKRFLSSATPDQVRDRLCCGKDPNAKDREDRLVLTLALKYRNKEEQSFTTSLKKGE